MAFPCPQCGDRNTQSLPMAYGGGTYVGQWRSRSGYRGTTISQNFIGSLASPPIRRQLWKPLLCLMLVTLWFTPFLMINYEWMFGNVAQTPSRVVNSSREDTERQAAILRRPPLAERVQTLLAVLALGASLEAPVVWWLIRTIRFNREVYPGLLHHWQIGFLCRRCGVVFYPQDAGDGLTVPPRPGFGYR